MLTIYVNQLTTFHANIRDGIAATSFGSVTGRREHGGSSLKQIRGLGVVAFSTLSKAQAELPDPRWARTKTGYFHRLLTFDPEANGLTGASGVYVVWHGGVNPGWVFIGRGDDLARTFHDLADDEAVMSYNIRGGIFVTWSLINKEFQNGVVRHLNDTLRPKIENAASALKSATPVPVSPPRPKSTAQ